MAVHRARDVDPVDRGQYYLGVDGISALLVLMTTLMGLIADGVVVDGDHRAGEGVLHLLLVLQTGTIGAFMALDALLFFLFWEVMLVPMYFLIGIWGGGRPALLRDQVLPLHPRWQRRDAPGHPGALLLRDEATGAYSFDITRLHTSTMPADAQKWIFLALFLGFAIKVPMFPFHTWLPDAHTDAPTAGSVILAAVLLKMGTYGFVRFSLPILPEASRALHPDGRGAFADRDHLRRARRPGAVGLETPGRLFERQPHGP